ncbi:MAG: hypothetical protein KF734_15080 [Saprospiraceae bacterium]|nr:hypothetical protein [Saprospiraceae bacterium]
MSIRDQLWKTIFEDFFQDSMYFFFPQNADEIDFSHAPEFLDKELARIFPRTQQKGRVVDKLVKIRLKNGRYNWLLIHIEVQGYHDPDFPKRMYQAYYRISERYDRQVAALAVLTDENERFLPDAYERGIWGTRLRYEYPIYKVSAHPPEEYEGSLNPFAIVMEAAYYGLQKHRLDDEGKMKIKLSLVKKLLQKGFEKEKIRKLLDFIDGYVNFENMENHDKFAHEIDKHYKSVPTMTIEQIVTKHYKQLARKQGREEGIAEGRAEGRAEGIAEVTAKHIEKLLVKGFATNQIAELLEIPLETVEAIQKKLANTN